MNYIGVNIVFIWARVHDPSNERIDDALDRAAVEFILFNQGLGKAADVLPIGFRDFKIVNGDLFQWDSPKRFGASWFPSLNFERYPSSRISINML